MDQYPENCCNNFRFLFGFTRPKREYALWLTSVKQILNVLQAGLTNFQTIKTLIFMEAVRARNNFALLISSAKSRKLCFAPDSSRNDHLHEHSVNVDS